jgi:hypothetical protein
MIAQFALFASAPTDAIFLILIFVPAVSRCCSSLAVTGLKPMSTSQYADQKKPKSHMVVLTVMDAIPAEILAMYKEPQITEKGEINRE